MFGYSRNHCYNRQNQFQKMNRQSHNFSKKNFAKNVEMSQGIPNRAPIIYGNFNYEHWCETCDKGFKTMAQLEVHKQQHQKCNIDGCQFIAHPNVITKHIQMQHSTGLYKKISSLNNPEDIKKWREERKRKYPTKENIEKKAAEIKEKIDRGEKMGLPNQRKINSANHASNDIHPRKISKHSTNFESTEKRNKPLKQKKPENPSKFKNTNNLIEFQEKPRKLKPFAGIQSLILEDDEELSEDKGMDLIDDDEYDVTPVAQLETKNITPPQLCGALSLLIRDYESSDEEFGPETASIEKNKRICSELKDNNQLYKTKINVTDNINYVNKNTCDKSDKCNYNKETVITKQQNEDSKINQITPNEIDSDSGPEEVEVIKENHKNELTEEKPKPVNLKNHRGKINKINKKEKFYAKDRNLRRKLPSTLLEKLLHKEILQERNIVLQCIRHIVKHNFFE